MSGSSNAGASLSGVGSLFKQSRQKLPRQDEFTHRFYDWLGDYVGDHDLLPEGLNLKFELALYDLRSGGHTDGLGRPIPHALTGQPFMMYTLLGLTAERDIQELLPADFAAAFAAVRARVKERGAKSTS